MRFDGDKSFNITEHISKNDYFSTIFKNKPTNENLNIETVSNTLYDGISWLYSAVETTYMFDYKVVVFWLLEDNHNDSLNLFFSTYWALGLNSLGFQLLWSLLLDSYLTNQLTQLALTDDWSMCFLTGKDGSIFLTIHPEAIFFLTQIKKSFLVDFLSETQITNLQQIDYQNFLSPTALAWQFLLMSYVYFIFASFYFCFYNTSSKEEMTIDADYLVNGFVVETEKEVGPLEDVLMQVIPLMFVFLWYFNANSLNFFEIRSSSMMYFFLPLVIFTVCNTPTFLLQDFGILYNCYLRGIVPSSSLFAELLLDYISVLAFYLRILTQSVRLVLMFSTYAAMHEFVLFLYWDTTLWAGNVSLWEDFSKIKSSWSNVDYFIVFVLPTHIGNWLYEVYHTFFVVTGQTIAFISMIYWLFLFLFTFFITEKQEKFFEEKRTLRQKSLDKIINLKKSIV